MTIQYEETVKTLTDEGFIVKALGTISLVKADNGFMTGKVSVKILAKNNIWLLVCKNNETNACEIYKGTPLDDLLSPETTESGWGIDDWLEHKENLSHEQAEELLRIYGKTLDHITETSGVESGHYFIEDILNIYQTCDVYDCGAVMDVLENGEDASRLTVGGLRICAEEEDYHLCDKCEKYEHETVMARIDHNSSESSYRCAKCYVK